MRSGRSLSAPAVVAVDKRDDNIDNNNNIARAVSAIGPAAETRGVCAFLRRLGDMCEEGLAGWFWAYADCRRNKRSKGSAVAFSVDWERRVVRLFRVVRDGLWRPMPSDCFIVTRPKLREVFAAEFVDRVAHHWAAMRLEPLLEAHLTDRSFSCRRGKGQLYGANVLRRDIYECSEGYTRDCWGMRLDIQGFFMSVDRAMAADTLDRFIERWYGGDDKATLRRVCRTIVTDAPEKGCRMKSPQWMWDALPPDKSLFTNGEWRGMPIGNLPSQMVINLILDDLDRFVIETLGFRHYGRYVDDIYIVHHDKAEMLAAVQRIRGFLSGMGLTLHPRKFYIQHYTRGVPFVGYVVKRDRLYVSKRTVKAFEASVRRLNAVRDVAELERAVASVNSYLGHMRHCDTYNIRRRVLGGIDGRLFRWVYIRGHYETVMVKRRFRRRARTMRGILERTWR